MTGERFLPSASPSCSGGTGGKERERAGERAVCIDARLGWQRPTLCYKKKERRRGGKKSPQELSAEKTNEQTFCAGLAAAPLALLLVRMRGGTKVLLRWLGAAERRIARRRRTGKRRGGRRGVGGQSGGGEERVTLFFHTTRRPLRSAPVGRDAGSRHTSDATAAASRCGSAPVRRELWQSLRWLRTFSLSRHFQILARFPSSFWRAHITFSLSC